MATTHHQIEANVEAMEALRTFKKNHGRTWRAKLLILWANGQDYYEPHGSMLRTIRNSLGPSEFLKVKVL
jgi:hypothetical protein